MVSFGAIIVLGYVVAFVLAVALAVVYMRGGRIKLALDEATSRLSRGQKGFDELSKDYAQIKHEYDHQQSASVKLEKSLEEMRHKAASFEMQLAKAREETKESLHKLANEKEHWQQQAEALTVQLKEAIEEKRAKIKEMEVLVGQGIKEGKQKIKVQEDKVSDEFKGLLAQLAEKEKEARQLGARVKKLEEILSKINPEEIRRTKIKAHRMEQLYNSMKGLREMADERNQNWEVALRELAAFIIKKPEVTREKLKMQIGPLVGEALEIAGVTLVHDEHVMDAMIADAHAPLIASEESGETLVAKA